jgi:hypothetical protein
MSANDRIWDGAALMPRNYEDAVLVDPLGMYGIKQMEDKMDNVNKKEVVKKGSLDCVLDANGKIIYDPLGINAPKPHEGW